MGLLALLGFEVASICSTYSVFFGGSIFSYRFLPKGDCRLCCPIQKDIDITFNLFTSKNPTIPQQLFIDDIWSIESSFLDPNLPTTFYVHGFTERAMGMSARTVKDAYLKRGTHNVIVVDWGGLSGFPYYAAAVKNTRVVGKYLAEFIRYLHNSGVVSIEDVHVIGFSLGAEVSGFAGKALGPGVLPRITGLDPAFPLYIYQGDRGHLAPSDARFVDIIHTDGGVFGFPNPIGHADFYPNGGVALQPGCRLSQLARRGHPEEVVACSHNRAWMYYAESVNNEYAFPASFCPSYDAYERGLCNESRADSAGPVAYMGYVADGRSNGMYFLSTNDRPPYGLVED
ncbi:UNVERIFIED_CONTAM: hypothetical protein PYX00_002698 [Menopon gallinae]|uniref:Lipase domain-containing protein n=1 Tax=Menopon gallinae TaxID=328185 RepID=A0AAW2HYA0_9NEOP